VRTLERERESENARHRCALSLISFAFRVLVIQF
jgi:hypothetical protein